MFQSMFLPRHHCHATGGRQTNALAALATVALFGCGGERDELSRDAVAEKIAVAGPMADTMRAFIAREGTAPCANHRNHPTTTVMPVWASLEEAGLIQLYDSLPPEIAQLGISNCFGRLTSKGEAAAGAWTPDSQHVLMGVYQRGWTAPLARREVVEVTGVSVPAEGGSEAEATFRWRWQMLLPDAKPAPGLFRVDSGEGRAALQRFDDGWRVVGMELDNAPSRRSATQ